MLATRMFDLARDRNITDRDIARAAGVSTVQVWRVKRGENGISTAFITAALKLFPDKTFEDLFFEVGEKEDAASAADERESA